jgi:hypothetical protein
LEANRVMAQTKPLVSRYIRSHGARSRMPARRRVCLTISASQSYLSASRGQDQPVMYKLDSLLKQLWWDAALP